MILALDVSRGVFSGQTALGTLWTLKTVNCGTLYRLLQRCLLLSLFKGCQAFIQQLKTMRVFVALALREPIGGVFTFLPLASSQTTSM